MKRSLFYIPASGLRSNFSEIEVWKVGKRMSGSDGIVCDSEGRLYYGLLEKGSVMVMNATDDEPAGLSHQTTFELARDEKRLLWINDMFIG